MSSSSFPGFVRLEQIQVLNFNPDCENFSFQWMDSLSKWLSVPQLAESQCRLIVPLSTFVRCSVTKYHQINTYSTVWVLISRERSQSGTVQSGKVPDMVLQEWGGREMGANVFVFFLFREPGSPLSSFVSIDPTTAPCLMASRGATNHNTTTLTHRPHSTRVYYHTTIFQPNTVNRDNKGWKC